MKSRKARRGRFSGHAVPIGYVVNYSHREDPDDGKYIIYHPHADIIEWLFRRYRQLDGNLSQLHREVYARVQRDGYLFPDFQGVQRVPPTNLRHIEGGYTVTYQGLWGILTNPIYLGWWLHKGEIISRENHDAIVSEDDFWWAFEHLSPVDTNGEEWATSDRPRRKQVRETMGVHDALLSGVVRHPRGEVYAFKYMRVYTAIEMRDTLKMRPISVKIDALDDLVIRRMLYRIKPLMFQNADNRGLVAQVSEEAYDSRPGTLKRIEARLLVLDANLNTAPDLVHPSKRVEWLTEQNTLIQQYQEVTASLKKDADNTVSVDEALTLLERATNAWDQMRLPERKRLVSVAFKEVMIETLSPHIVKITLVWKLLKLAHQQDVGFYYRGASGTRDWTPDEIEALVEAYPTAPQSTLMQMFPERSMLAMESMASEHGVRRIGRQKREISSDVSLRDIQVAEEHGLELARGVTWRVVDKPAEDTNSTSWAFS